MKLRTHFIIAKIAAECVGLTKAECIAFCVGSLIPDLSPMQFVHRHFYESSGEYVLSKLNKLSNRQSLLSLFEYGKMAHYLSDFCCSVHVGGNIGNVREHMSYERKLNRYALENYETFRSQYFKDLKMTDINNILSSYFNAPKFDFYTDIIFAVKVCCKVCETIKNVSWHLPKAIPSMCTENVDGSVN